MASSPGSARMEQIPAEMMFQIIDNMGDLEDIYNLTRCSHALRRYEFLLYRRDSREGKFAALRHASLKLKGEEGLDVINKCLETVQGPVKQAKAVNTTFRHQEGVATALHFAAALGNTDIVERLVAAGANVSSHAIYLSVWLGEPEAILGSALLRRELNDVGWLPTMMPYLRKDMATYNFLYEKATPTSVLAMPLWSDIRNRAVTTHHVAAILNDPTLLEHASSKHPGQKDLLTPRSMSSVVHFAIHTQEIGILEKVEELRYSRNKHDATGNMPIHTAIHMALTGSTAVERKKAASDLEFLIAKMGANAMQERSTRRGETPLIMAAGGFRHEWSKAHLNIRRVIASLLKHGANINSFDRSGNTILGLLTNAIIVAGNEGNESLEKYFRFLVKECHADVNLQVLSPDAGEIPSVMLRVLLSNKRLKSNCPFLDYPDYVFSLMDAHWVDLKTGCSIFHALAARVLTNLTDRWMLSLEMKRVEQFLDGLVRYRPNGKPPAPLMFRDPQGRTVVDILSTVNHHKPRLQRQIQVLLDRQLEDPLIVQAAQDMEASYQQAQQAQQ
ncbi:hypothetical protein FZEAL_3200 [Fusarium zealandicum]|uniref:Ankyrin n=1 Tax=Fusarium zealandicum TaxID=1053134 RepID=A0A8H4XM21_9HYPO|nr:hypothetical protein FZEAL_3200 [Fusarium zealandicum]